MSEETTVWREPVAGFVFAPDEVVIEPGYQRDKLAACGLDADVWGGFVDPSFYIGVGIRAGIRNGISAEGNVNMLSQVVQHQPVALGETLIVKGVIRNVTPVPRGSAVETDVWFETLAGERAISVPRTSLRPDPAKAGERGAGDRPPPVIGRLDTLTRYGTHSLTPERVRSYSSEGNSIHYEMAAANRAGFRAPIIGGGMGVHYLLHAMRQRFAPDAFELAVYFRRPIFWDDTFTVMADESHGEWRAACLVRFDEQGNGKVLTEAAVSIG